MKGIKLGLILGGKSAEHEISILSAFNVYNALDTSRFKACLLGINREGKWFLLDPEIFLSNGGHISSSGEVFNNAREVFLAPSGSEAKADVFDLQTGDRVAVIEAALPILHGPNGEDGSVQGFLQVLGIPFVGAGVLGSAIGMDKDVSKRLLRDAGIEITKFKVCRKGQSCDFEEAVKELGLPLFVKPSAMGSSVGVSKVEDEVAFQSALNEAFRHDRKIIIEEGLEGVREIECSVLGNEEPRASTAGEVIAAASHGFYSYEAKYLDEKGAELKIPAELPKEINNKIKELAVKVYKTLELSGMARVDFFLTAKDRILVNEVNTIPGFTNISMYPMLWEESGLKYTDLITRLIELAFERHNS